MSTETPWHKSSHSGSEGDNCVEVAEQSDTIHVRDSKDTGFRPLRFSPMAWSAFTAHTAHRTTS